MEKPVRNDAHVKLSRRQRKQRRAEFAKSSGKHYPPTTDEGKKPDQPPPRDVQQAQVSPDVEPELTDMPRSKRRRRTRSKTHRQATYATEPTSAVPPVETFTQPTSAKHPMYGEQSPSRADFEPVGNAEAVDTTSSQDEQSSIRRGKENRKRKRDGQQIRKTDWSALLKSRSALKGGKKAFTQLVATNPSGNSGAEEGADRDGKEGPARSDANEGEESPKHANEDERLHRTVFVGNVPLEACQRDIKKLFQPFGRIESVRIRGVTPVNPKLPKRVAFVTGKFAQFADSHQAYVVFAEEEGFEKAMDDAIDHLNMTIYTGHHLRVKHAGPSKRRGGIVSVFVGNLPFDCREEELIKTFQGVAKQVGAKIMDARVNRDQDTGVGRGIGFVSFNDSLAVQACMNEAENLKIRGRVVRVEAADKERKRNTKTSKRIRRGTSKYRNKKGPPSYRSRQRSGKR